LEKGKDVRLGGRPREKRTMGKEVVVIANAECKIEEMNVWKKKKNLRTVPTDE